MVDVTDSTGGDAEGDGLGPSSVGTAAPAMVPDVVGSDVTVVSSGPELPAGRQPILASRRRFEITARDRLFLQLAKLPQSFHQRVTGAFGGPSLLELTATDLAQRLGESNTPPSQLRDAGYPAHIVDMVKRRMATGGLSSAAPT